MDKVEFRKFDSSRVCPEVLTELKELAIKAREKDGSLSPEVIENLREIAKKDRESHFLDALNFLVDDPLFPFI